MDGYITTGVVSIVIGFFIVVGICGYAMTLSDYELEESRGPIIAGIIIGGLFSLAGGLAFFYGLADYIVTGVEELKKTIEEGKEPRVKSMMRAREKPRDPRDYLRRLKMQFEKQIRGKRG